MSLDIKQDSINAAERVFRKAQLEIAANTNIVFAPEFARAVSFLLTTRVWSTGMGKAGIASHKFAATLACNGRPAAFLHAAEALHGDFGAIQPGDTVVAFSNSGKTDEVIKVADKAKNLGAYLILITSHPESEIAQKADIVLAFAMDGEACPLGLTPTTSVTIMSVISDALCMAVQREVGLTFAKYAENHHNGYLGQIATLKGKQTS